MKEIFRQISEFLRGGFLVLLVLAASALAVYRLIRVQVAAEDNSPKQVINQSVYTQSISATRGEIVDSDGNPIVSNRVGYHLIIEKAYFPGDKAAGNDVLLRAAELLQASGYEWNDTMPVSRTQPYTFDADREKDADAMRENLRLNTYATAENCIDKLISDYAISEDYTAEQKRIIAGIRYEMLLRQFSMANVFYLAKDIDLEFVTKIKELRVTLPGINIAEAAVRTVEQGDILPHEIGYVGPIYSEEEYETLLENGHDDYALSDTVGKTGLESAMEATLRGINGKKEITVTNGEVSSVAVTEEPVGGKTIQLTVNSNIQRAMQRDLDAHCYNLRVSSSACRNVFCGASVLLDAHDNAVLGMATVPTYNLDELLEDYKAVTERSNTPLVNRATDGLYRPGSTFKTITATAGLDSGLINGQSTYDCEQTFRYIDTNYHCTGCHHFIAVSRALTVSCNIFFYNLGLNLGIDRLCDYERLYGLGSPLGLESGDSGGYIACPESFDQLGMQWYVGEITQASIGQSEVQVTPLQMAVVASTIANKGVRYKPHLIASEWNNTMTEKLWEHEPEVAANVNTSGGDYYYYIEQGMIGAAKAAMPAKYDLNHIGVSVALKTGTPQRGAGTDTFVIGYAPVEDPEIAFCAMIEGGMNAKYLVRQMMQAYAQEYPDSQIGRAMYIAPGTENAETSESE